MYLLYVFLFLNPLTDKTTVLFSKEIYKKCWSQPTLTYSYAAYAHAYSSSYVHLCLILLISIIEHFIRLCFLEFFLKITRILFWILEKKRMINPKDALQNEHISFIQMPIEM